MAGLRQFASSQQQSACTCGDRLDGLEVLLAEDEFVIAFELQAALEARGAGVTVVDSVADGLPLSPRAFHAAVLDVRLADGDVYPLADRLYAGSVPIVFHSGHAEVSALSALYPGARAVRKPSWGEELIGTLAASVQVQAVA